MRSFAFAFCIVLAFAPPAARASVLAVPEYEVTGTNARLPSQPTKVLFDGIEEVVVNEHGFQMRINESVHVVDGSTWLEFSFEVDPGVGLAKNFDRPWEIGVTNLQFNHPVYVQPTLGNGYFYFKKNGQPVPMQGSLAGDHPWNDAIPGVWFHPISKFDPESPENDLPPGVDPSTTLDLYHQYGSLGNYLAQLGVPADVTGFHFGCRVVPEPSTVALLCGGLGMLAIPLVRRRRRATLR